jgi:hypothetical protein
MIGRNIQGSREKGGRKPAAKAGMYLHPEFYGQLETMRAK